MRRQARISTGGALVVRSASALQVWLWLLLFVFQNEFRISRSIKPGYLDFDNLPETNFTCTGKVIGGYYADLETSCQMFHVCTVGQQDEPMDIKFLCLNGTVFDQETRVCERVDEVDCTKSETFYSLNLELYGSTVPPIIQPETKPQAQPTEQSNQHAKPSNQESDPHSEDPPTTTHDKAQEHLPDTSDSTEDPVQYVRKEPKDPQRASTHLTIPLSENGDLTEEYQEEEEDSENPEYEDDYSHSPTTTSRLQTTTFTTTTTVTVPPTTTSFPLQTSSRVPPHIVSSSLPSISSLSPLSPDLSSLSPPIHSSILPSAPSLPTLDPSLLSPQEFIYRHRGPGSEAISFQRQSFRPADGVYITHAPSQQFDHFQYESSRTAPRPVVPRPAPFVQRPQPAPFRPTTLDPRDQLLRPGPTSQPSERHESVNNRPQSYPQTLTAQRPLPFNIYYDRKRSDDSLPENESSLSARSVVTEKPPLKPKSPPRVIVTASASVSDSNGKRLNYTVGNVVSAVKPIVAINYDDYKESDLIFDPFFLDVPKLQKRRKTRSNRKRRVFTVPATATVSTDFLTEKTTGTTSLPVTSKPMTTESYPTVTSTVTTTTAIWNPDDYVDDNYEPHAYIQPAPPLAVFASHDRSKGPKQERQSINYLVGDKTQRDQNSKIGRIEQSRPTSAVQTTSSQSAGGGVLPLAPSPPPPPPFEASACATKRSTDCRTRA